MAQHGAKSGCCQKCCTSNSFPWPSECIADLLLKVLTDRPAAQPKTTYLGVRPQLHRKASCAQHSRDCDRKRCTDKIEELAGDRRPTLARARCCLRTGGKYTGRGHVCTEGQVTWRPWPCTCRQILYPCTHTSAAQRHSSTAGRPQTLRMRAHLALMGRALSARRRRPTSGNMASCTLTTLHSLAEPGERSADAKADSYHSELSCRRN